MLVWLGEKKKQKQVRCGRGGNWCQTQKPHWDNTDSKDLCFSDSWVSSQACFSFSNAFHLSSSSFFCCSRLFFICSARLCNYNNQEESHFNFSTVKKGNSKTYREKTVWGKPVISKWRSDMPFQSLQWSRWQLFSFKIAQKTCGHLHVVNKPSQERPRRIS